ncbi:MAG: leucyl/phenylalanyl-tRNA--protein transferase, partial [Pseudomonadales bacterium]|nr:leucyl/phenylalanyl-tRNA--protein transferase [Pseudomonadales bacterium]
MRPTSRTFPPIEQALREPNGLLAVGGELSAERLVCAYRAGIFPWYEAGQPVLWWSPDPRAVIKPEAVHIARSLRKSMRKMRYALSMN